MKDTIHKAACAPLGVIKRYINRNIWLWHDNVEMKMLYHEFLDDKTLANWQIYKNANWEAKKAIAIIRAVHYKDPYAKLNIRYDERNLYRFIKG